MSDTQDEVAALQSRYDELMNLCGSEAGACADALGVAGDALDALRRQQEELRRLREALAGFLAEFGDKTTNANVRLARAAIGKEREHG